MHRAKRTAKKLQKKISTQVETIPQQPQQPAASAVEIPEVPHFARFENAPFVKHISNGGIGVVVAEAPESIAVVARVKYTSEASRSAEIVGTQSWEVATRPRAEFMREWFPWQPFVQPIGAPEKLPLSIEEALRKMIKGNIPTVPPAFGYGALEALVSIFPRGPVCLFEKDNGFVHCFNHREDAELIASKWGGLPIIFESAAELGKLDRTHLEAIATALDAKTPAAIIKNSYLKELYEMASKAKGKQGKKVSKVQGKAKRAGGTVAKLRAMFDTMKDRIRKGEVATADLVAEALKRGYTTSAGTVKTQLQQWRGENGIKAAFKRSKKVAPAVKKASAKKAAKAAKKPAAKKPTAKKPASKPKAKAKKKAKAPAGASANPPASTSTPEPAAATANESASAPAQ